MATATAGISGFSVYLPPHRVQLEDWCRWSGDQWDKVSTVIGNSFRICGANENAYTMAATAVLQLIERYDVDPAQVGFLGFGTESSTDNSAGAVIIKGMVNQALKAKNAPELARECEVPEFKHACLGGMYALKAATRYVATDGGDRVAIVVCADIAEYARASSGEPTQGAGAVAMLVEPQARLLSLSLAQAGSASAYRGADFRKPFTRFMGQTPGRFGQPRDFPVFNGKYSTTCYVDEVLAAARHLFAKATDRPSELLREMKATFLHRPYQRMAETGLAFTFLLALALGDADDQRELAEYAHGAQIDPDALAAELVASPDVHALIEAGAPGTELYPLSSAAVRYLRDTAQFAELSTDYGHQQMREVGNLYTASLPAWMAAGLEQAAQQGERSSGDRILAVGYGSGDAAELIPMQLADEWQQMAQRIGFDQALNAPIDLDEAAYVALHDGGDEALSSRVPGVFYIDMVGSNTDGFSDLGIEYYRYDLS
jgi:hydroxymethylglutaryl-CoA synthase